jgi:hypothetical protein
MFLEGSGGDQIQSLARTPVFYKANVISTSAFIFAKCHFQSILQK